MGGSYHRDPYVPDEGKGDLADGNWFPTLRMEVSDVRSPIPSRSSVHSRLARQAVTLKGEDHAFSPLTTLRPAFFSHSPTISHRTFANATAIGHPGWETRPDLIGWNGAMIGLYMIGYDMTEDEMI